MTARRLWLAAAVLAFTATACVEATPAPATTAGPSTSRQPDVTTPPSPTSTQPPAPTTLPTTTTVPPTTTTVVPLQGLALEVVAEVRRPVGIATAAGDARIYIVEQHGRIQAVDPDGTVTLFADLTDRAFAGGIEQGLLGLAFHPTDPQRFFVYYSDATNDTHLDEFRVAGDAVEFVRELLAVEQPTDRHNGGMLTFDPDGYLWVGLGEGGAARANAQDPATFLGSMLRLDVDGADPYGVPPNPFVDEGGAPEVWAIGLRNPWRFTIDPVDRLVYIGDVGHSNWEEIDVVSIDGPGANFGWLPMEGTHCYLSGCDPDLYDLPVLEYDHSQGCSVTGGVVYRGPAIPELDGVYVYGDWCMGWVRSFRFVDGEVTDAGGWFEALGRVGQVASFGTDPIGELLIATWEGPVYRVVPQR